jgi:two-component system, NarL family, response regulator DegU
MSYSRGILNKALPKTIKIALVDDQPLFRAGINSLLKDFDQLHVILEASNGKELLDQLKRLKPHVILLDIEMPEMNGIETTIVLKEKYPDIKVIILTMHNEEEFIFDLISKGAHGFLPKDKSVEEVVDAIYAVMEKGKYYSEQIADAMVKGSQGLVRTVQLNSLTEKEIEIIKLICKQKTNNEIAEILGVSSRTIENYRTTILLKTNTKNTAGMVVYALKNKLVSALDMI